MQCALATFSRQEIEKILQDEGIAVGTPAFYEAVRTRFDPSDTGDGYVERDDGWDRRTISTNRIDVA